MNEGAHPTEWNLPTRTLISDEGVPKVNSEHFMLRLMKVQESWTGHRLGAVQNFMTLSNRWLILEVLGGVCRDRMWADRLDSCSRIRCFSFAEGFHILKQCSNKHLKHPIIPFEAVKKRLLNDWLISFAVGFAHFWMLQVPPPKLLPQEIRPY